METALVLLISAAGATATLVVVLNIAGIKQPDRSMPYRIIGWLGLLFMIGAVFAELLHAPGYIKTYIGDLTPLKDETVPSLYYAGCALVFGSAIGSSKRAEGLSKAVAFCVSLAAVGIVTFFLIGFSYI